MWPLDTGDKELSFWLHVLPTYAILGKLFSFSNPAFPHPHNRGKKCAFLFVLFENEKKTCKQSFELLAAMEEALRSVVVISIMKPVHLLLCLLAVHGCQAVLLAVEFPSTQHQVLRFLQERLHSRPHRPQAQPGHQHLLWSPSEFHPAHSSSLWNSRKATPLSNTSCKKTLFLTVL